ncbi:hypothetical protein DR094_00055 [Mycoplasma flocculare]|uniref:DUF1410 domain-containing protein n=1 Tax=Mesomycoplasma flocculare TaxID=2128 RepID=A0AAW9XFI7_MESFC|nr:hypothetical protein [Mesomycoplasma flocculare]MXR56405.1 hypothetical protein [Mesomycoplasma flocculare]
MDNQNRANNKTKYLNNYFTKKLFAGAGFISGSLVALSPYLAKIITPKTIYIKDFVISNLTANSAEINFRLKAKNKLDNEFVKNADLELIYINNQSRYITKSKVVYDPKTDSFSTYSDNLLGGSTYQLQLVSANNPRYYFNFLNSSQFFSTKNQVEKFSYYDIANKTILNLDLHDSQNLLDSANLILYYKQIGSDKILSTKSQFLNNSKQKQASFSFYNLSRIAKYEILGLKYYYQNQDELFDLEISPLANRYFSVSPLSGKIVSLNQKSYGLNSALIEIGLLFDNQKPELGKTEKINLEYYWRGENGQYQFEVANDVSLIFEGKRVYANLDLSEIPGGAKFWISRIWNNSGTLKIKTDNKFSFISAPEVAKIKTFVSFDNISSFDVKFNDQSLLLNGKDVKINFFADDAPNKILSTTGQVVGNKLFSFAKNLAKEKHFTIDSLEILGSATNFDETKIQDTKTIFFSKNFDPKEKKFFTYATSATIESVSADRISEDTARISVILDSIDDFIKDNIATLYFKVAGSSNLLKSAAEAFKISGNKLVLSWDLINLEPGTTYFIDSIGIADSKQYFVNKLYLNFGTNINASKLNWTTRPAVSSITYTKKSPTSLALNIAIKNVLENLKTAKIKYSELKPNGSQKTINALIENNTVISNLLVQNLEKGLDYRIDSIEIDGYKSSKNSSDILAVSKTISPAQRIFGLHAPLVLKSIKNESEEQTSAKLKVEFSPETIRAIGDKKLKIYYSLAGSSKLLSQEVALQKATENQNSVEFSLTNLEIGAKYNINSIVLSRKVTDLNGEITTLERNVLFGDETSKLPDLAHFYTKSAIVEVGYDNSYEQRVIATFILADAKGVYSGKTAKLKYKLKAKNGKSQEAQSAQHQSGEITAPIVGTRIRFDITDLYKQGLYEIDENSLEIVDGKNQIGTQSTSQSRVRREVSQFQVTKGTNNIPFKAKLLDKAEKKQFLTIPKTANVTSLELKKRTKNSAEFEIEFGRDFPEQKSLKTKNQAPEKLDDFLNSQSLKVRFKKYGGTEQEQIVIATKDVQSQKTSFSLKNLENGQQYVILGFDQVETAKNPKVNIYLDDLDFYKDQIIATSAVIQKLEIDTSVETQAKVHLELKDGGRYTAGKKVSVQIEKVDGQSGVSQNSQNLVQTATSLNGVYDFTFLNLEKLVKYKIKSVKFENAISSKKRAKRAISKFSQDVQTVLVNVQSDLSQEEEIELLEAKSQTLEAKKAFITKAQSAKIVEIKEEGKTTKSLSLKFTLDAADDYLSGSNIELEYKNLSTNQLVKTKVAKVALDKKTLTFQLDSLNPGDKYEILALRLKNDSVSVRNLQTLQRNHFEFAFDKSPHTKTPFSKKFFSPTPNLSSIKTESTSETSARISVKLNDKGANWNSKYLKIKLAPESSPKTYTSQISNGLAVFEINGLKKAGEYQIQNLKVLDTPSSPAKVDGNDIEGFNTLKEQKKFELEAESATIVDISYKSDNNSADILVKFAKDETFLNSQKKGKRKLKFYFKDSLSGPEVSAISEFGQISSQQPELTLTLDSKQKLKAGGLYLLSKIEDVSDTNGPKKLTTFKFAKNDNEAKLKKDSAPAVLDKLFFATKPEIISYSFEKKDETTYIANFEMVDPLAGRGIEKGGFENREVKIKYQKLVAGDGSQPSVSEILETTAKAQNSKFSFEIKSLEKNAVYKLVSVDWADRASDNSANITDPTIKLANSNSQQKTFASFAVKDLDANTKTKIEGQIPGNGLVSFGQNFIIKPESAKVISIEKQDKQNDKAIITLTFDNTDKYLKHTDYKNKLKLVYYQVGAPEQQKAILNLDNSENQKIKFKTEIQNLSGGNNYKIVGLENDSAPKRTRRSLSPVQNPLTFYFDDNRVQETAKEFATLPIINSILQLRNPLNPGQYDFIITLKDAGKVFRQNSNIKAKIQYKKVLSGKFAKASVQEVITELQKLEKTKTLSAQKSEVQSLQDSASFKFTLKNLDLFAQYYIEKIAYDSQNPDNILAKQESEVRNSASSGYFRFDNSVEEKRAFITFPSKVIVDKITIKPDFAANSAKLELEFAPKYKGFLEIYHNFALVYKTPKGLFQEINFNTKDFTSSLLSQDAKPKVSVEIKNIQEPGKYLIDHIKFTDKKTTQIKAISNLELPPVLINETISLKDRSFYTNTKITEIRKKYIGETNATIELVIADPSGSYLGKQVEATFKSTQSDSNSSNNVTSQTQIVADIPGVSSKAVFEVKTLNKLSEYTIEKLEFAQATAPKNSEVQFQSQKHQVPFAQNSKMSDSDKKFTTKFETATALGITYQLDQVTQKARPWEKAKIRVFFSALDKPLSTQATKLKLVYESSKDGISSVSNTETSASIINNSNNLASQWQNQVPETASLYYEFSLDRLDAGAQYKIIGLKDSKNQVQIIVPNSPVITTTLFATQPSPSPKPSPSFSFNTAPLISKMSYIPAENAIKLILDIENSQKINYDNSKVQIKYKKLKPNANTYGWQDPTKPLKQNLTSSELTGTVINKTILAKQQESNTPNTGLTRLEVELTGLEKGSWYLIDAVTLTSLNGQSKQLQLYLDKENIENPINKLQTNETSKWPTIINTSIESVTIQSVKTSSTPGSNLSRNSTPQLDNGKFEVEFPAQDAAFLKDKYELQLELESVEKKVFFTNTVAITAPAARSKRSSSSSSSSPTPVKVQLEAKNLLPGDSFKIKNYIFKKKNPNAKNWTVNLPLSFKTQINKEMAQTPPSLITANAIKSIQSTPIKEGETEVFVIFYNKNKLLDGKKLTLQAELDQNFDNKFIPTSWKSKIRGQSQLETSARAMVHAIQVTNKTNETWVKFKMKTRLKKGKQYKIKNIYAGVNSLTFANELSNPAHRQRLFYSKPELVSPQTIQITKVSETSATISLSFADDDAFLSKKSVSLVLKEANSQNSQSPALSVVKTLTFQNNQQNKAEFTFDQLVPGTLYTITGLVSDTLNISLPQPGSTNQNDLIKSWENSQVSSNTNTNQLQFITKPQISNIVVTPDDTTANLALEGITPALKPLPLTWRLKYKDLDKKSAQEKEVTIQPEKFQNKITNLTKWTNYQITKISVSSSAPSSNSPLNVSFSWDLQYGKNQQNTKFKTTAKHLEVVPASTTVTAINTNSVELSVKFDSQSAKALTGKTLVANAAPQLNSSSSSSQASTSAVVNPKDQTAKFLFTNLNQGQLYKLQNITTNNSANSQDQHNPVKANQLIIPKSKPQAIKILQNRFAEQQRNSLLFAPLADQISMLEGWTAPNLNSSLTYQGETIYIKFNKSAATILDQDWLEQNLDLYLLPAPKDADESGNIPTEINLTPYLFRQQGVSLKIDNQAQTIALNLAIPSSPSSSSSSSSTSGQYSWTRMFIGGRIKAVLRRKSIEDPTKPMTPAPHSSSDQQIIFSVATKASVVRPMSVDYMYEGLLGFTYLVFDPTNQLRATGRDEKETNKFERLSLYNQQSWLKVAYFPNNNNNILQNQEITREPIAIRTYLVNPHTLKPSHYKYLTVYYDWNAWSSYSGQQGQQAKSFPSPVQPENDLVQTYNPLIQFILVKNRKEVPIFAPLPKESLNLSFKVDHLSVSPPQFIKQNLASKQKDPWLQKNLASWWPKQNIFSLAKNPFRTQLLAGDQTIQKLLPFDPTYANKKFTLTLNATKTNWTKITITDGQNRQIDLHKHTQKGNIAFWSNAENNINTIFPTKITTSSSSSSSSLVEPLTYNPEFYYKLFSPKKPPTLDSKFSFRQYQQNVKKLLEKVRTPQKKK